jgi:hypothetical protein
LQKNQSLLKAEVVQTIVIHVRQDIVMGKNGLAGTGLAGTEGNSLVD